MTVKQSLSALPPQRMPEIVSTVTGFSLVTILTMSAAQVQEGQSHFKIKSSILIDHRLISIMLSRLRMSVDEAIEEYEHLAGYIFGHPRLFSIRGPIPFPRDKYSSKRVVDVIQDVVLSRLCGRDASIGQDLFASHGRMCKT